MKKYQFRVVNQVGITFGVTEGDGLWRAKIVNKIVTVAFAIMLRLHVGIAEVVVTGRITNIEKATNEEVNA